MITKTLIIFVFLCLLLDAGCSYMVRNDKRQIYLKPRYGLDKFISVQGYNLHYVEAGEGEPILLIPGAFSTYRHWNRVIPYLSEHYKLLCLDYLGVGDSDKPKSGFGYTIEEQADLIVKMIEALQIQEVHILGVSYGGAIALNLAARYPEKVDMIVSIEGNGIKHQNVPYKPMKGLLGWPVFGELSVGVIRSGIADKLVAKSVMGKAWEQMSEAEKKEIVEIMAQNNKTASRVSWRLISQTIETSKDFSDQAKTIRSPVLYLYGADSYYHGMAETNAEFLKHYLPNVEIVRFNDGIHDLELQKPKEVADIVLQFLSKNRFARKKEITKSKISIPK
ncbi:MAG TPA: alpha/beta hydrolase [Thermodesulfobacteriota bacterium]|nr:alpha/beta hydrolase [Thermodesulfobacteriota bacterium]